MWEPYDLYDLAHDVIIPGLDMLPMYGPWSISHHGRYLSTVDDVDDLCDVDDVDDLFDLHDLYDLYDLHDLCDPYDLCRDLSDVYICSYPYYCALT